MPAFRYVKLVPADAALPSEEGTPQYVDVTFVAGGDRRTLDESMAKMGYQFSHVMEGPPRTAGPISFPGAAPSEIAASFVAAPTAPMPSLPGLRAPVTLGTADTLDAPAVPAKEPLIAKATRGLATAWSRTPPSAVLTLALVATLVVHGKVVESGLIDEDFVRFLDARAIPALRYLTERFDGLFVGTYELCWSGVSRAFGLHAGWYFRLGLLHHLVNVAIVYGVARALSGRIAVAAVSAALWGVTPGFQLTLQSLSAYGALMAVTTVGFSLLELARAAEAYRPPTALALLRVNVALILAAGTMPGAWLAGVFFPAIAVLLLPPESSRGRSALALLPAALISLAPAVAFAKDAMSLPDKLGVIRLFFESVAYGTSMVVAGIFSTIHANARGMGLFTGPSYGVSLVVSGVVAVLVLGFIVWRLLKSESEARRETAGLLLLAGVLYLGLAIARGALLGNRGPDFVAARTPFHYAANVPIVLALAGLVGRIPVRDGLLAGWRSVALGVAGFVLLLLNANVSSSTYAVRPERSAKLTEYVDMALEELVASAPDGAAVFVQNDEFATLARARSRGTEELSFPGVGAYWALVHGAPVILPELPPALATVSAKASASASAAPPPPAPTSRTRRRPRRKPGDDVVPGVTDNVVVHGAKSEGRPVRFVVMEYDLLRKIYDRYPASISEYFVTPAAVNHTGSSVLTLEGASQETREQLEKASRGLSRVNDL